MPKATDIRIEDVRHSFEDFAYRTPIKFGGVAVDRVTLLNVECRIQARNGQTARGFGSMPLGNVWSFPSKHLTYDGTLAAMKALAERYTGLTADCREIGHPLDINHVLEPLYLKEADAVTRKPNLADPIPPLCRWSPPVRLTRPFTTLSARPTVCRASILMGRTSSRTILAITSARNSRANTSTATSCANRSTACRCITSSERSTRSRTPTSSNASTTACRKRCPNGSRSMV